MGILEMFDNAQNAIQMLQQLKTNPVAFAAKMKYSIPQGMTDPEEITNYLARTGQIRQSRINSAMSMRDNPIIQKIFGGK